MVKNGYLEWQGGGRRYCCGKESRVGTRFETTRRYDSDQTQKCVPIHVQHTRGRQHKCGHFLQAKNDVVSRTKYSKFPALILVPVVTNPVFIQRRAPAMRILQRFALSATCISLPVASAAVSHVSLSCFLDISPSFNVQRESNKYFAITQ